jgi:hypothetical protein
MNDGYQTKLPPGQPGARDVQPLGAIIRTVLRKAWIIGLVGAAAFALVARSSSTPTGTARATVRVGLTSEVVWPFYDATRDRLELYLTEAGFDAEIEEGIDGEIAELTMSIPANQAFVEITAVADNGETAAAAATFAAQLLSERSISTQQDRLSDDSDSLRTAISDLANLVDELNLQIQINLDQQDPLRGDLGAVTELARLGAELQSLELQRDSFLEEQLTLTNQLDTLTRQLASVQPEAELLRRAEVTEPAAAQRPWAKALFAGLAASMVAAVAVIILDREFGRVRTPWHAEAMTRIPTFGHITEGENDLTGLAATADRLLEHLAHGTRVIGLSGSEDASAEATIDLLARRLPDWSLTVLGVEGPASHGTRRSMPESADLIRIADLRSLDELEDIAGFIDDEAKQDLVLVDLDGDYETEDAFRLRSRICGGIVVIAAQGRTRAPALRARTSRIRRAGETLLGVLLIQPAALSRTKTGASA